MITKRILQALVLVGLFAALVSGAHRRRAETENQRVEIALDYNELRALAGAEGVPLSAVLQQFRQAGAVSVTLQEDTVGALEEARRITAAEGISPKHHSAFFAASRGSIGLANRAFGAGRRFPDP